MLLTEALTVTLALAPALAGLTAGSPMAKEALPPNSAKLCATSLGRGTCSVTSCEANPVAEARRSKLRPERLVSV